MNILTRGECVCLRGCARACVVRALNSCMFKKYFSKKMYVYELQSSKLNTFEKLFVMKVLKV
jgi:hypothetical protein